MITSWLRGGTTSPWADRRRHSGPEWVPGGRQNQISGQPGHRKKKIKNNRKDNNIIICISNAHRDDAHAFTLYFFRFRI